MTEGYPFAFLKVDIGESFVDRVVARLGGRKLDGVEKVPEGVRLADYLVDGYALEFKRIERDPIVTVPERVAKIADYAIQKALAGETPAQGKTIRLKGDAANHYWRKFGGTCVGRAIEDAADQVTSTRTYLKRPDLKGAVFVVNVAAAFIDPESLSALTAVHRDRFKPKLDIALCFSAVPGMVEGTERPVVMFAFHADEPAHGAFGERFQNAFESELAHALGRSKLEGVDAPKVLPVRAPFTGKTDDGTPVTIH